MKSLLALLFFILAIGSLQAQTTNHAALNRGREGQLVQIEDYVRRGKTTVISFGSRSSPTCRALAPKLEELAAARPDLYIGTLEVNRPDAVEVDWNSPLSRHFRLRSLPHFKIFNAQGELEAEGEPARRILNKMLLEGELI